jgi:hypothetical protein
MDKLKCPSCGYLVGDPLRPGEPLHVKKPISSKDLVICARCLEFMLGSDDGTLRIVTSKERAYLFVHRTDEMVRYLQALILAAPMIKASES